MLSDALQTISDGPNNAIKLQIYWSMDSKIFTENSALYHFKKQG